MIMNDGRKIRQQIDISADPKSLKLAITSIVGLCKWERILSHYNELINIKKDSPKS